MSSSNSTSNVPAEQSSSLTSESTTAPSQIHENPPIPDLIPDEVHNYAPKKEPGETSKTPPVNFIMTDVGTYKRSSTTFWMSTPFRSHQLGYKLYLAVRFSPADSLRLEMALGSVQDNRDSTTHLRFPCIGDAIIKVLNPHENKNHIKVQMGFTIHATIISQHEFPEGGSFVAISENYIDDDCLNLQVTEIHLDDKYRPWLLDPSLTNTHDSDSDIDCSSLEVD